MTASANAVGRAGAVTFAPRYDLLPTWRVIALDDTFFVSAFGKATEGHTSPMYKISTTAYGGALHRGFLRFIGELRRTVRRVI